jgi:ketosteroid isomerase-like protein
MNELTSRPVGLALLALVLLTGCALSGPGTSTAQSAPQSAESQRLRDEIARQDKAMFDAFNAHDIDALMALFSEDLEFYHDTGGRLTYGDVRGGFKSNFDKNNGLRRELLPESLEVYPIQGYGAIEIGRHRFCHQEGGRDECGTFGFLHIWQNSNGSWKVTRVVSYDH